MICVSECLNVSVLLTLEWWSEKMPSFTQLILSGLKCKLSLLWAVPGAGLVVVVVVLWSGPAQLWARQ